MTRIRIAVAALALGSIGVIGVASAHASGSCPSGSSYVGGRAGGVCISHDTGDIVKTIRN